MPVYSLDEVLHPQSIAVVGTNKNGNFVTPLINLGFKGKVYPVNPKYDEILGLKAYPTIKDIPGNVDYVISAVPAPQVLTILKDCEGKSVKGLHLFTARFSETGRKDAIELEKEVLSLAKKMNIRIIGPNCMGVYYPKLGISWQDDAPKESGSVALSSQSGQAAGQIISMITQRGIFFNKAVSYGNAIDFNESDFIEYYAQDPDVSIILMYIEGPKDGKRFSETLRRATRIKPVIILKGGRGQSGARAVASHTASLASAMDIWNSMIHQSGAVSASSMEELLDLAVSFYYLPKITGRRVGVSAGAGGATVLAADLCEEAGLDVIELPQAIREELKSKGIKIWDWIGNPSDFSIRMGDDFDLPQLLKMMAMNPEFDLIISQMGGGGPPGGRRHSGRLRNHTQGGQPDQSNGDGNSSQGGPPWMRGMNRLDNMLAQFKEISEYKPLLGLIPNISHSSNLQDGDDEFILNMMKRNNELARILIEMKIPYYPTISRAANAASKLISYYEWADK